jgi:hypothetical protein
MAHQELLSDQDFQQATDEQIFALVDKLDAEIQRRGMSGIRWREPEELLEPSDPADPVDL